MLPLEDSTGYQIIVDWLNKKGFRPFLFQQQAWQHIINGESGLVNAPTGCGKTYSVFLGAVIDFINHHPTDFKKKKNCGLQLLWITPLRALAKDIGRAMEEAIKELGIEWKVGIRNGDTSTTERNKQKKQMPEVLITTPESLHLLLAQKDYPLLFSSLKIIAVDEWHELLGSKRGVQVELAVSRIIAVRGLKFEVGSSAITSNLKSQTSNISVWGISATIGNLDEAKDVLLSPLRPHPHSEGEGGIGVIVRANLQKQIEVQSIFPDEIETYPWAGHLGIKLAHKIIPIIQQSRTTLIFINTRGMSETWYQRILDICPELAGSIALHHGSIDLEMRNWVEENLHTGNLKAVVCTASLDLGVDFRPVETVIQVGSPKGVARFLQRAGRSGHSPDAISKIYFLPTHSLELAEAAALKNAIEEKIIESRVPMLLCYDVLIQFLSTLALSEGFIPDQLYHEIKSTFCYREMEKEEWDKIIHFITTGGHALQQYDDYKKFDVDETGLYRITNRRIAMMHRMSIGTIVSEAMMKVQWMSGGYVGVIEEYFISRLEPGEVFSLAGRKLELVSIKDMTAYVKKSNAKKSIVPSWNGGRMPLSANLGKKLREALNQSVAGSRQSAVHSQQSLINSCEFDDATQQSNNETIEPSSIQYPISQYPNIPIELEVLKPLFELQETLSHVPKENELLIEHIETEDGFHLFVYPFEGRLVHEAMAAILAYRISRITPITFSFAMNDYGFELLSDKPIPVDDVNAIFNAV
jgi:ATP-dependent Lhr-like helicase